MIAFFEYCDCLLTARDLWIHCFKITHVQRKLTKVHVRTVLLLFFSIRCVVQSSNNSPSDWKTAPIVLKQFCRFVEKVKYHAYTLYIDTEHCIA